jgi:uncharacterized membrane protein YhaH (DUF805 family)
MLTLFAQRGGAGAGGGNADPAGALGGMMACFGVFAVVFLIVIVIAVAILWKVFTKAGQPGWAAVVPFYNQWILVTEICKKEPLWFVLSLIPFVNIIAGWVISMELAKKFGKSETFGIGIFLLGPVFLAILAFGDAEYQGGRTRRGGYDLDDEYEDDRPRKKPARDDFDDEEEEERPRKKKKRRTDDYDDE